MSSQEGDVRRPSPPTLSWRALDAADLPGLADLARACLFADGGLPSQFAPDSISERYFPPEPSATHGGFTTHRRLIAAGAVRLQGDQASSRVDIVGQIDPGCRRRGIGTYLVRWSESAAAALLAEAAATNSVLRITTESLTDDAERLYQAAGFVQRSASHVMRRDLRRPLSKNVARDGLTLLAWSPDVADQFAQAYEPAFSDRPGFPGWSAAQWIEQATANDLVPAWSLLARVDERPVGFVIGCLDLSSGPAGGYVWQVGVVSSERQRGIGSTLLVESMRRMKADGAPSVHLVVHDDNAAAIRVYENLGFEIVGRRAQYERAAA